MYLCASCVAFQRLQPQEQQFYFCHCEIYLHGSVKSAHQSPSVPQTSLSHTSCQSAWCDTCLFQGTYSQGRSFNNSLWNCFYEKMDTSGHNIQFMVKILQDLYDSEKIRSVEAISSVGKFLLSLCAHEERMCLRQERPRMLTFSVVSVSAPQYLTGPPQPLGKLILE